MTKFTHFGFDAGLRTIASGWASSDAVVRVLAPSDTGLLPDPREPDGQPSSHGLAQRDALFRLGGPLASYVCIRFSRDLPCRMNVSCPLSVHIYIYTSKCVYIYIYIWRERPTVHFLHSFSVRSHLAYGQVCQRIGSFT